MTWLQVKLESVNGLASREWTRQSIATVTLMDAMEQAMSHLSRLQFCWQLQER